MFTACSGAAIERRWMAVVGAHAVSAGPLQVGLLLAFDLQFLISHMKVEVRFGAGVEVDREGEGKHGRAG